MDIPETVSDVHVDKEICILLHTLFCMIPAARLKQFIGVGIVNNAVHSCVTMNKNNILAYKIKHEREMMKYLIIC